MQIPKKKRTGSWIISECQNCGKEFETRKCISKKFCCHECYVLGGLKRTELEIRTCIICKIEFSVKLTSRKKTCGNRSCASKYSNQIGDFSNQRKAAANQFSKMNKNKAGKTLDEIYGIEKAAKMRQKFSERSKGENNPAFGKNYKNGGKSIKGYYKGIFFRSLLEYSFMKHLESLGFNLNCDIDYECFHIPYKIDGRNRTYTIDFYVKPINTVYEVKPQYQIKMMKEGETLSLKINAAKDYFKEKSINFGIVTENNFSKISFSEALLDENIKFDERTFKYFSRK